MERKLENFKNVYAYIFTSQDQRFSNEPDPCYYHSTEFSNHLRVPNFSENIAFCLT